MHKTCFDGVGPLYEANACPLDDGARSSIQTHFQIKLRLIDYLANIGRERRCFALHQYEIISKYIRGFDALFRA